MTGAPLERVYRVLLVDDEALLCRAVQRLMSDDARFDIRTVTSPLQAAKVFGKDGPFDVLLADLRFPDGADAGEALARALTHLDPSLRVIFMSGDPESFTGPGVMLGKPFERDELVAALEAAVGL